MAAEESIILGLGVISALLGYFAFELSRSEVEINRRISLLLAFMSLAFLNIIMYTIYKIAQQSLTYLVSGVLETGLLIMMWTTLILVFVLLMGILWGLIKGLYDFAMGKKSRDSEDEASD